MGSTLSGRVHRLEALMPSPLVADDARRRLAEKLASVAERLHGTERPEPARLSPAETVVYDAMEAAAQAGEWGTAEYAAAFWRAVGNALPRLKTQGASL